MFTEKLRSLLKFGPVSTRFKDIFDMYYLLEHIETEKLLQCLETYIFKDDGMNENCLQDISRWLEKVSENKFYMAKLNSSNQKWIDEDADVVFKRIRDFFVKMV